MEKVLRILAIIMALPLALIAVRWVVDPSGAAQGLEMTLLEGAARNSQIGDTTAVFFGMGFLSLYGIMKKKRDFLYAATFLIAVVAVARVLAGLVHDAPTIWLFVAIEAITVVVWLAHAKNMKS
ncbi:MAG: DUF4345 family protein [Parvibaculales bacterium]